jgi:hypothetical protein
MARIGRRSINMSTGSRTIRAIARFRAISRRLRAAESDAAAIGLWTLAWVEVAYCLARGRTRARSRSGRYLVVECPVLPLFALLIEGAVVVVVAPIRVERESHDGHA